VAKQSGLGDRCFVDGFDLSGDIGSLSAVHGGPAVLDVTGIDKSAYERIGGIRDGGLSFSAFMNDSAGQAHPRLKTLPRTDVLITYLRGTGIGSPAASLVAKQINYDGNRDSSGALTYTVEATSNAYGLEWGLQLTNGIRTDTTATNGTGLDTLASASFGMQAYLQVFAVTGTSVTVAIEDSADNATFLPVSGATFVAASTTGGQRIALANTANVRRYVRAVTTGTFTNAQFCVQVVKNEIAGQVF
jgi:hypothetical protein